MNEVFEQYLEYNKGVRQYSLTTINSYKNDLHIFDSWLNELNLDVFSITISDLRIFISELADRKYAASSINRMMSVLRGFYKYAVRFNFTDVNPSVSLVNFKVPQKLPVFMFPKDAMNFCALPENAHILWKERDAAIFASLYSTGCRVFELAGLDMNNLDSSLSYAVVLGKGKKERKVFFADFAKEYLKVYLAARKIFLLKHNNLNITRDALFLNCHAKPLTSRGIRYIITKYVAISPDIKRLFPHAFRHSFASTLVMRGADIRVVQELLGHESVSTTQRYTHITDEILHSRYKSSHPHS